MRAVLLETIRRRPQLEEGDSPRSGEEFEGYREVVEGVIGRLERLEEERDFYKDLLDAPGTGREIAPPTEKEDASDTGPG